MSSPFEDLCASIEFMKQNDIPTEPVLIARDEKQAELWRKWYPRVEVIIGEQKYIPLPDVDLFNLTVTKGYEL